jgi:hypothetical protein
MVDGIVGDTIVPRECAELLDVDQLVEFAQYAPSFYKRLPEQVQKNTELCEAVLDAHVENADMCTEVLAAQVTYDADSALGKKLCYLCVLNPSSLSKSELRNNRQFVLDAVARNSKVMEHIGFELREDFNFVLQCIVSNFDALDALDEEMLEDDDYKEHHRLAVLRTLRNAQDAKNLLHARLFAEKKQQAQEDQERLDHIEAYQAFYNQRNPQDQKHQVKHDQVQHDQDQKDQDQHDQDQKDQDQHDDDQTIWQPLSTDTLNTDISCQDSCDEESWID